MNQEWKPGDVAIATIYGHKVRVVRGHKAWITTPAPDVAAFPVTYSAIYDNSDEVKDARPLAVIDPESAEDRVRLATLLLRALGEPMAEWEKELLGDDELSLTAAALSGALREFTDPTPRIEEPTGLGAVVEDADGSLLTKANQNAGRNWVATGGAWFEWSDIDAVRVLSEGVPA